MPVTDGLYVVFDPAIDGGAWPGPLRDRDAVIGEAWLGPLGLLDRLEVELGLLARHATATERVADLSRKLASKDGFWRRSFEIDPISTSRRLLADRGTLALWGWRGEPASERLVALWAATNDALPGVADRLRRIVELLARRHVDITTIRIVEPLETLAPLWRHVFEALRIAGVRIDETPLVDAVATGDLAAARSSGFVPRGDGTLQLVRPHGPLAAADEVAAALAAFPHLRDVVLIGSDAILDEAMVRHGLPRVGAEVVSPASSVLVRLIVESAFTPMDPADLHALLCTDPGPVPRGIARRLASALQSFPSRGAPTWRDALAEGLSKIDEAQRSALARRLTELLDPVAERGGEITLAQLTSRMRTLTSWARGRLPTTPSLSEVITFAEGLLSLAEIMGLASIGRPQLRRLCDEVDRRWVSGPTAEAGIATVPRAGAVLGPVRVAVWWGFSRDMAPAPPRLRLSQQERAALRAAGVTPPDAGTEMAGEARRWRRPLSLSSDVLVLVCPRTNEASDTDHPHPLWDELCSSMSDPATSVRLQTPAIKLPVVARRARVERRPLPVAIDSVRVPGTLTVRNPESPSSVERLLGCSLAWALHYPALLRSGLSHGPSDPSPLLFGTLAHHVLAQVFADGVLAAETAATRAEELIDVSLDALAENLSLPDHQVERSAVKRAIIESAREVGSVLTKTGASIRGAELPLSRTFSQLTITGRADLVLANPDIVIDYKWGPSANRQRLVSGTAIQLATYAELGREGDAVLGVAYLMLRNQQLMVAPGTNVPDALQPGAHAAGDMWRATVTALDERLRELSEGKLGAPGALVEAEDSILADGVMRVAPPCHYCELATLCGRRGRA